MNACRRVLRMGLLGLAVLGTSGEATGVWAQSVGTVAHEQTVQSVRRMLERLPYYGVFDYIVFRVDGSTVYLAGYSFEGRLKTDAELAVKRASGVTEVANKIEVLPASQNDDRIRWTTFYRIYADDFLSRYAPGGRTRSVARPDRRAAVPGHATGRPLPNSHRREGRPNHAARHRRQRGGSPDCRSPRTRGQWRVRCGERSRCGSVGAHRPGVR